MQSNGSSGSAAEGNGSAEVCSTQSLSRQSSQQVICLHLQDEGLVFYAIGDYEVVAVLIDLT